MTDEQLWERWKRTKREADLLPLMERYNSFIDKQVAIYGRTNISPTLIRAKAQINLVDAFKTYDPSKGVKLNTHVNWQMNKIKRFVAASQNFARIPEPMVFRIGEYKAAASNLKEKLGRDPSIKELADNLKWPMSHVERMQQVLREDLSMPLYDIDPALMQQSRWEEVKTLLPYELGDFESKVYEMIYKSPTKLTNEEIARKLNTTPAKVSNARKEILNKITWHMR